jgi:hypothetical protein
MNVWQMITSASGPVAALAIGKTLTRFIPMPGWARWGVEIGTTLAGTLGAYYGARALRPAEVKAFESSLRAEKALERESRGALPPNRRQPPEA